MDRALRLRLLGAPAIHAGGQPLDLPAARAVPLLTLLACGAGPVPRDRIATLLWRRVDQGSALASLRQLLHHLPQPVRGALMADRTSVALDPGAVACDLWELRSARDAAGMLAAYPAPLLDGRVFDDFPEFDDWLRLERAQLAAHVRGAVQSEMARALPDEAVALARRWLAIEPADEEVHARLMELHVAAGRVASAESQYEALRRVLATTSGRAPQPATRAILEQALRRHGGPRGLGITPVATSFVGRQEELAEIARLAADPHCRLITLHGPGGVGKTRLAMAFAEEAARHGEAVRYAGLEAADTPAAFYATLAAALEIEIAQRQDPRTRILDGIEAQRQVLVLDNFEQLLPSDAAQPEPALFVAQMLRAAPHLKILVTSRVALGLQEEWLLPLDGLPYPEDENGGSAEAAVELFVSRARQAYRGFSSAAERPHVLAICRAADGLPLALELAAAQVGMRPCADIARDLLAEPNGRAVNRPDRQASLLHVVEQSLVAATPEQARAFAALSLFRGAFTAAQAFAVARVGEGVLAELASRALLQRAGDAFRMHPLLRQVAARRLQRQRAVARRVEEGYVAEIARRAQLELDRMLGRESRAALATLPARFDDELQALQLAAAHGDGAHVMQLAEAVAQVVKMNGALAAVTLAAWPDVSQPQIPARARAALLFSRALFHGGDMPRILADLDAALQALGDAEDPQLRFQIGATRANLHMWSGEYREAVALCESLQEPPGGIPIHARIRLAESHGTALAELGEFARAEALLDAATQAAEAAGASAALMAHVLNASGGVAQYRGDVGRCAELHRRALALLEAEGFGGMCAPHHCNLGAALMDLGEPEAARQAFQRAIEVATRCGMRGPVTYALIGLADEAARRRDHAASERHAGEARALARRMGSAALECESTTLLVRARLAQGDAAGARGLLTEQERQTRGQDLGFRRVDIAFSALMLAAHEGRASEALGPAAAALLALPGCTPLIRAAILDWAKARRIVVPESHAEADLDRLIGTLLPGAATAQAQRVASA